MSVFDEVLEVAVEHHGYVTARQATEAGIDPTVLRKLVAAGRLERASQGVYRLPALAGGPRAHFAEAIAWTGGRGVLSHESALDVLDLCDVNPPRIHLTVPAMYAPRRAQGERYRVWRRDLPPSDVMEFDGLAVVKPVPAIRECLRHGTDPTLLRQAIVTALGEGYLDTPTAEALRLEVRERA